VIGAVFLYSGYLHLANPILFASTVRNYEIVPEILVGGVALGLPALLVFLAVGVLFGPRVALCLNCLALVCTIFVAAQAIAWWRGAEFGCGCFGFSEEPISLKSMGLPLLMFVGCVATGWTRDVEVPQETASR